MLSRYLAVSLFMILLEGSVLNASSTHPLSEDPFQDQNLQSDVSTEADDDRGQATGREDIAYLDGKDQEMHSRFERKGDWNYQQNQNNDRGAFYRGEAQGTADNLEHPNSRRH